MRARHLGLVANAVLLAVASDAAGERPHAIGVLKGPYLTGLSDSGVEVRCELDGASPLAVEFVREGGDAAAPLVFEDRTVTAMHIMRASGLAPAVRYAYAIRVAGKTVARGQLSTAPRTDSAQPLKFLVYGDDRSDPTAHAAVVRALAAAPSDFLVNTGDLVEDGGRSEDWQSFFDIEGQLLRDRPLFVAIGNHELYDDAAGANFARYFGFTDPQGFPRPYGTMRLSNVRFFFVNAMHDWRSADDRAWLERELVRADTETGLVWRIAVMHQGPWSSGPHGASAAIVRAHVPELLAAHGVDLLFSGHDHIYERGDGAGIKYVISGGGGAPLYRIAKVATTRMSESTYHFVEVTTDRDALHVLARRIDGSLLDQCGFKKSGAWDCDATESHATVPAPSPASPAASSPRCACRVPGTAGAGSTEGGARGVPGGVLLSAVIALICARRREASG